MKRMTARFIEKLHLSAQGLLNQVRKVFYEVSEPHKRPHGKKKEISISNCLMSALAMFKLKFPSLLQFEENKNDKIIKQNLKNLFDIDKPPCDSYMRERLDELNPREIRPAFTAVFSLLQRGKVLEKYTFLEGKYLALNDGTGYFSSNKIHCKNCCIKHHQNETITYYHQFLGFAIAHPDYKEVIPLCPEPIMKEDGAQKNDCERNATERLLKDFRREHPHLPIILVEDALASNGPHLKLLGNLDISFITVVKPEGNKALFDWVESFHWGINACEKDKSQGEFSFVDKKSVTHKFRFVNKIPLNDTHPDFKVNFIEYWGIDSKGKTVYHNTWITDILITQTNAYDIARGGRTRWHIENETFNTLKNQGYHFEHNFGHGNENLSTVFALLMMLAFLIDQCEQLCCGLFQGALTHLKSRKIRLWDRIRGFFSFHIILSWASLYRGIIEGSSRYASVLDTC